jgi:hypothetical protein
MQFARLVQHGAERERQPRLRQTPPDLRGVTTPTGILTNPDNVIDSIDQNAVDAGVFFIACIRSNLQNP